MVQFIGKKAKKDPHKAKKKTKVVAKTGTNVGAITVQVKPQSVPRQKLGNPMFQKTALDKGVRLLCSLTDPFCPAAKGARLPTGGASRTFAYQSRTLIGCTLTAATNECFVFCPSTATPSYFHAATTSAPNVTSFTALINGDSLNTTVVAGASAGRLVSAGVKWFSILPSTTAGGAMIVTETDNAQAMAGQTGLTLPTNTVSGVGSDVNIMDIRNPCTYIFGPKDETGNLMSNFANINYPYTQVIFQMNGSAAGLVGYFEYVCNYEYEVLSSNAGVAAWGLNMQASMGSPAPPDAPQVMAARNTMQAKLAPLNPGGEDTVDKVVKGLATSAMTQMLKIGGEFLIEEILPMLMIL
jgi:hypothetical protein